MSPSDENPVDTAALLHTLFDQAHQQQLKKTRAGTKHGLDDDGNIHGDSKRRNSLPPFKKRHLDFEQDRTSLSTVSTASSNSVADHPAMKAMKELKQLQAPDTVILPQDIAARLLAFEEAQRRSNASRELLAEATRELQQIKQLQHQQRQQRLIRMMALNVTAAAVAAAASASISGEPSDRRVAYCGSRSGSMANSIASTVMTTGAAW
jgi:hypothetical protein